MTTFTTRFAGFPHEACELSAYAYIIGVFTISLKNGRIINYEPEDVEEFRRWLQHHCVRNINE